MTDSPVPPSFTLAYVPGVTPGKWVRTWNERLPEVPLSLIGVSAAEAADLVLDRAADAVLLRLPTGREGLHAIPLYTETTVVVVPKDHPVTVVAEVSVADLADDVLLHPLDETLHWERPPGLPAIERPGSTADAIELVAAGVGLLVVPQSLARLHHRRDLTYVPVSDAPQSRVALSWLEGETTDLMEQFIGIVRGRTVNSTRGRPPEQPKSKRAEPGGRKPAADKATGRNGKRGAGAARGGRRGRPRRRS
ncbi:LysR family transcriptional regulator substrate-binding protein [Amycolatopsis palatopharyngis]|uniref:LysR family transcriptional regulator substrate-binding protein n=1 Tax=Amycolatopsis palatopharyngis TaxID=187982 RepID=UPI001FE3BE33|nr:LysR family transcriptional regulator substrate-binding protein [Amycolatopsis palatopharyngis]